MTLDKKPSRPGRLFKWVLALSLALNLVVVGLFAGAAMRFAGGDKGGRFHEARGPGTGASFLRALPKEARRSLREKMRTEGGDMPSRAERRAVFEQMVEALRQEPFDREQMRVLFEAQVGASQGMRDRAQEGWLELVGGMTAAERAEVADNLEKGMHHKGEKKR